MNTTTVEQLTEQDIRAQLAQLQARYDSRAVSPAIFSAIRLLEVEISWLEHRGRQ
jgi:hypothetical protein